MKKSVFGTCARSTTGLLAAASRPEIRLTFGVGNLSKPSGSRRLPDAGDKASACRMTVMIKMLRLCRVGERSD